MPTREERARARREAAPAAVVVLLLFVVLAVVSRAKEWELAGLPWWTWLLVAAPALLLAIDLTLTYRGRGLARSRNADLLLLGLLVLGNLTALALLVDGLVKAKSSDLGGGELLLTGFAIWAADVIVFGLAFWELEAGGPVARRGAPARTPSYFQFPQDENQEPQDDNQRSASSEWRPRVWDYLYVGLTNGIAFSPTDAMPLSVRAKAIMGLESALSAVTVLLVAARAVNILGS